MPENKSGAKQPNLEKTGAIIREIAEKSGKQLRKLFEKRDSIAMSSKGGLDYVSTADLKLDNFITTALRKYFPRIPILSEETAADNYSSLKKEGALFVIDPIDGTKNFKQGKHDFGIGIAMVRYGISILGVVSIPMYNELYYADANTLTTLNGKPVKTSSVADLSKALFCTDWAYNINDRRTCLEWLSLIYPQVQAIQSPGSAVANLAFIASGKVDVYLQAGLKPWDVASASIIIRQAGGIVTTPNGGDWDVFNPDILAACTPALHKQVLDLIKTV